MIRTPTEIQFDKLCQDDPKAFNEAKKKIEASLREQGALFGDGDLPISLKPHFVDKNEYSSWISAATALIAVIDTLCALILEDEELYRKLNLPKGAKELLSIPHGYSSYVPSCRPDFVWDEGGPKLLEINADSPAMMTFTDMLETTLCSSWPNQDILNAHTPDTRTRFMLDAILKSYHESSGSSENPTIAIVDWHNGKTKHELVATARYFESQGCPSFVCSPNDLTYEQSKLKDKTNGRNIDVVQRRVLFPEFLRCTEETKALIGAYRDGNICMVNPLSSYIVGNKNFLALLSEPALQERLLKANHVSTEELSHIKSILPQTFLVDEPAFRKELANNRVDWVLKSSFSYGGNGVFIGNATSQVEWLKILNATENQSWVAQRLLNIPEISLPVVNSENLSFANFYINWCPWIFGGKYAGATSRSSANSVVSITCQGALHPTIAVG